MDQVILYSDNPEYDAFVNKFKKHKMTTDDCYTPPQVYEAVRTWACNEYGIEPDSIVRPFYPGGDYENYNYPDGCTVLDNPPFSILVKICRFYLDRGIRFFLFAPSLKSFSGRSVCMDITHIICDAHITYHNGALIRTAFVTNMGGDVVARTAPDLLAAINEAMGKESPRPGGVKYKYPDHVLTAAKLQRYSKYGIDLEVRKKDCVRVGKLDAQSEFGKKVFGAGLLISDDKAEECAAAERAVAERAVAYVWELSDREREVVKSLGG